MGFFKGTQELIRNSLGKRVIIVRATEGLLYLYIVANKSDTYPIKCLSYQFTLLKAISLHISSRYDSDECSLSNAPLRWHMVPKCRRIDVDATSSRRIDVNTTSFLRHVPAGLAYT